MYYLVEREKLPANRHYEQLADGRCIVGEFEMRVLGTLEGVTVVRNSDELRRMMAEVEAKVNGTSEPETSEAETLETETSENETERKEETEA